jgi:hypothetical protein
MDRRRHRIAIALSLGLVLGLAISPAANAQDGKQISRSLCALFSKAEVREAIDVQMGSHADPSFHDCTWSTSDIGDPERYLNIGWLNIGFDDLTALANDRTALTVGGREALFDPIAQSLALDLDQGVLVMGVTDRTGEDWQAALTGLGESAVARSADLVGPPPPDAALVALFPTAVGGTDFLMQAVHVDREFPGGRDGRGKALRSALKAAGKELGDVSMAGGQVPDAGVYLSALKVAGADAADFTETAIGWSIPSGGWTAEPAEFANGTVHAVSFDDGTYTRYFYPKDDIVWVVDAAEPALSEMLAALPGAPTLPEEDAPAEEVPADEEPEEEPADDATSGGVAELVPSSLGGEELTVQTIQGSSGGGFNDPKSRTYKALTAGLESQGKSKDDITIAAAGDANGTIGILGIEVDGADASAFVDFAIETILAGLPSRKHETEPVEVAGKAVTLLRPQQSMGRVFYIYPQGDIVWVVGAPDELLEEAFAALP